jgi:CRP-like cAMP-binding protein
MWIVHPNSFLRMGWDVFALFFILLECVMVPFGIGFEYQAPESMFWASTIFFAFDIVLNFLTGYFEDGILIMKQRLICNSYMKSWFILDISSTFPWGAVFTSMEGGGSQAMLRMAKIGKMLRMLRLLRVAKLNVLVQQVEDLFHSTMLLTFLKLGKIMSIVLLVCHWVACIWGWIGSPERYTSDLGKEPHDWSTCEPGGPCEPGMGGSAWRRRYGLDEASLAEQYLYSLRFAAGLFTGSDIGIQPGFWGERVFVVMTMFGSFIALSTIISKIVIMFHKISQDHQDQEELMMQFKEFMAVGRVPYDLQARIKRYLEYQFKSRRDLQVRRFEMIERLSPWLRKELQVHLNRHVLTQHPFFQDISRDLLQHCCCISESLLCAPGDVVMQKGQKVTGMYFLVRGKLHINTNTNQIIHHDDSEEQTECEYSQAILGLSGDEEDPCVEKKSRKTRKGSSKTMKPQRAEKDLTKDERFTNLGGHLLMAPGFIAATSLFKDHVIEYTVASVIHTELLKLCRDTFSTLLDEFPALRTHMEDYLRDVVPTDGYHDCSIIIGGYDPMTPFSFSETILQQRDKDPTPADVKS